MSLLKSKKEDLLKGMNDLNLGKGALDVDVNDKEREKHTSSDELPSHDDKVADGGTKVHQEAGDVKGFLKNHGATSKDKAMLISKISRDMKGAPVATDLKKSLMSMSGVKVVDNSAYLSEEVVQEEITINPNYSQYLETLKLLAQAEERSYTSLAEELDDAIFSAFKGGDKVVTHENAILAQIGSEVLNDLLWEASPVSMDDISDKEQKALLDVVATLNKGTTANYQVVEMWKGIHGAIATLRMQNSAMGSLRMGGKDLSALGKVKGMRWISFDGPTASVGF